MCRDPTDAGTPCLFGRGAGIYDHLVRLVFPGGDARARRLAVETATAGRPRRFLELGVGTGLNLPYYPPDLACVGVDKSPAMLRRAERRRADLAADHVRLLRADAARLPFDPASFDAVLLFLFCSQVLPHEAVFREIDRVTVPGARVVIVDPLRPASWAARWVERACDCALRPFGLCLSVDVLFLIEGAGWRVVDVCACPGTMSFLKIVTAETGG